jgi:hypothetical protein
MSAGDLAKVVGTHVSTKKWLGWCFGFRGVVRGVDRWLIVCCCPLTGHNQKIPKVRSWPLCKALHNGHYAQCPFMHSGFAASGMRRVFEAFFPLAGFA